MNGCLGFMDRVSVAESSKHKYYFYQATTSFCNTATVDSVGNTLDFLLSAKRDAKAAERFFRKVLKARHTQSPRVITVDKNAAYPKANETLKEDETLEEATQLRQKKYLNKIIDRLSD